MQTFSRPKTAKPGAASGPQISSAKKREPVHARFTGGALVFGQFARLRDPRAKTMTIGRGDSADIGDWRRRLRRISDSRWNVRADGLALMHEWGNREWGNRAAWVAAAVSALLFFYAVAYAFPNARRIALQQEREVVEQENRAFCEKHGMLFGTREHTVCAEDLMDIRANERQRTLDELGIF